VSKGFRETTSLSALVSLIRLFVMFLLNKITALALGPTGFAVIGHVQNIFSISQAVGGRSLSNGIIRFSSESADHRTFPEHVRAAVLISFVGAVLTGLFVIATNVITPEQFSGTILFRWLIPIIPISIFAASLTAIQLARFQGNEQFRHWFLYTVLSLVIQVVISLTALKIAGLKGIIAAIVVIPVIQMLAIPLFITENFKSYFSPFPSQKSIFGMNEYLFMGIVSVGLTPLVQVMIRNSLILNCGIDDAGLWQGVLKLSELGVMLVTSTLATWYLPKLAKASSESEIGRVMVLCSGIVLGFGIGGMILGTVFAKPILAIVFSESFTRGSPYLVWQLGILIIQLVSWALGSFLPLRGNVKEFIAIETIGQLFTLVFALCTIPLWGVHAVFYGFIIEGLLYLFYLIIRFRTYLRIGIVAIWRSR